MKFKNYNMRFTILKRLLSNCTLCVLLCILFFSCGNSENDSSSDGKNTGRTADTSKEMKVYLLPSPLQIASAMNLAGIKYTPTIFEKTEKTTADYQVSYLKALNLGIYSIDMGYSTVYSDHYTASKYASRIQSLMDELGIKSLMKSTTIESLQRNQNNNDSLYKIILDSYSHAHEYFKSNEREDVGLMILTGAFIEGLYISSSLAKEKRSDDMMRLIGIQKIFLTNIIELLKKYADQKDIKTILTKMDALNKTYSTIDVHYDSVKDKLVGTSISSETLNQICMNTGVIRNEIIN